jgi:hypothetical protein
MNLDNYVTVNERLAAALKEFPELRIVEEAPEVRLVENIAYIEVCVSVYRNTDDPLPAIARAWEPWPGKTPFTRDSEMMNAATSALGRALGYMGLGLGKSIATADEVQLRRDDNEHNSGGDPHYRAPREQVGSRAKPSELPRGPGKVTPGQLRIIHQMAGERGVEPVIPTSFEEASAEIVRLKEMPKP